MKILFVVSCNGVGNGGHAHSLNHITQALSAKTEVKIVSVGLMKVKVLKNNALYIGKFEFRWWNIFALNSKFKQLLKEFNPDVIHCFDGSSALILMAQPILFKKKIIYTKCGGPNERNSIAQVTSDVILFSKENLNSYKQNRRFKNSDIHLIPNRILKINYIPESEQLFKKDSTRFNFVRIARIGKTYFNSITESINLVAEIQNYNLKNPVKLYIIGAIESYEIFDKLVVYGKEKSIDLVFITNELTNEASRLLYLADAVIGTGRGVMEAMSLGIPTFVPVKGKAIPSLLRQTNFNDFFSTNFSPRGNVSNYEENEEINLCVKMINEENWYLELSTFSNNIAQRNFVLNNEVVLKYIDIYENVQKKPKQSYLFKNILPLLYYINAYRRVQKRLHIILKIKDQKSSENLSN